LKTVTIEEIKLYINNIHTETDLLLFDSEQSYSKYLNSK
jgi:hypothetical protein